eukprot:CAMPEP_0198144030 /NCGR_PEP_ID=MMETSP1443-20131203/12369_1 /TAXON_ID=186043 /ORGANISM="Entomoneis sp., Strain CCMP2396" /LENGTH=298 /DNA_ID=CAMNT_0043807355 /DNA_START=12 /DNA_END=908 /DNA_ORIENTATION=-
MVDDDDEVIPIDLKTLQQRLFSSFEKRRRPSDSSDRRWTLPDLLKSNQDGLSHVPIEILAKCVIPVLEGLRSIDAESLLELERAHQGAVLDEGVAIKPVHQLVKPACPDDTVRYVHLSDVPGQYSMGIFIFPPHAKIPLHDHPGMCVLSRVLYGSLQRLSLDLARDDDNSESEGDEDFPWSMLWTATKAPEKRKLPMGTKRAYKHHVDHLQAPSCSALYPYEGNLHEFEAGPDGAAVLDVLFPPYDEPDRDCTFYNIVETTDQTSGSSDQQPCLIVPTGQPEDFHCISGRYLSLGSTD